jgi:serpin B
MSASTFARRSFAILSFAILISGCGKNEPSDVDPQPLETPTGNESIEEDSGPMLSDQEEGMDAPVPVAETPEEEATPSMEIAYQPLPSPYSDNINTLFESPVNTRYDREPLEDVVAVLVKQTGFNITIHESLVDEEEPEPEEEPNGYDSSRDLFPGFGMSTQNTPFRYTQFSDSVEDIIFRKTPISCLKQHLPLHLFLEYLFINYGICWDLEGESIVLMSPELLAERRTVRTYDLTCFGPDAESVHNALQMVVDPSLAVWGQSRYWGEGVPPSCNLIREGASIKAEVSAPRPVLEGVDMMYETCLAHCAGEDLSLSDPWETALDQTIAIEDPELSLPEFIVQLESQLPGPILIDPSFMRIAHLTTKIYRLVESKSTVRDAIAMLETAAEVRASSLLRTDNAIWIVRNVSSYHSEPALVSVLQRSELETVPFLNSPRIFDLSDLLIINDNIEQENDHFVKSLLFGGLNFHPDSGESAVGRSLVRRPCMIIYAGKGTRHFLEAELSLSRELLAQPSPVVVSAPDDNLRIYEVTDLISDGDSFGRESEDLLLTIEDVYQAELTPDIRDPLCEDLLDNYQCLALRDRYFLRLEIFEPLHVLQLKKLAFLRGELDAMPERPPLQPMDDAWAQDVLAQKVQCDYSEIAIEEMLSDITDQTGATIKIDDRSIKDFLLLRNDIEQNRGDEYEYGSSYDDYYAYSSFNHSRESLLETKITVPKIEITLRLFLDYLQVYYGLCWDLEEDSIVLMRPELTMTRRRTQMYDLADAEDPDALYELMRQLVDPPDPYEDRIEDSPYCYLDYEEERWRLVVHAPRCVVDQADRFYPICCDYLQCEGGYDSTPTISWQDALDRRVAINFEELDTFEEYVEAIAEELPVPILMSPKLNGGHHGFSQGNLRQLSSRELSLSTILRFMEQMATGWNSSVCMTDDAIWIIDSRLASDIHQKYDIYDAFDGSSAARVVLDMPRLHDVSDLFVGTEMSSVFDLTYYLHMGTVSISGHDFEDRACFMVSASPPKQQRTIEYLEEVRTLAFSDKLVTTTLPSIITRDFFTPLFSPKEPNVAGTQNVNADFDGVTLRNVLEELCRQTETPLIFNYSDTQLLFQTIDEPVTKRWEDVNFESALRELEQDQGIECYLFPELLFVRKKPAQQEEPSPRHVYEITDLVLKRNSFNRLVWRNEDIWEIPIQVEDIVEAGLAPEPDKGGWGGDPQLAYQLMGRGGHILIVRDRVFITADYIDAVHELELAKLERLRRELAESEAAALVDDPDSDDESLVDVPPLPAYEQPSVEVIEQLVLESNQFAFDLGRNLAHTASDDENVFFSPYGISTAIGMVYAGARGRTAEQIAETLHFDDQPEQFWILQTSLQNAMEEEFEDALGALDVTNGMWVDQDYPIENEFLSIIRRGYGAEVENVDFGDPGATAQRINLWAEEATQGRINQVVTPNNIHDWTRFVLANSVYFQGAWESTFEEDFTSKRPFYGFDGEADRIDMMFQQSYFASGESDGARFLAMDYKENACRMLIVLPEESGEEAFESLEQRLDAVMLQRWLNQEMGGGLTNLQFPKFSLRTNYDLKPELQDMGMTDAFAANRADFKAIREEKLGLYIEWIQHTATLDVDEEGTVAAAVTVMGGGAGGAPPKPIDFFVDRPFLLYIVHESSGAILFSGRVIKPEPLLQATHP